MNDMMKAITVGAIVVALYIALKHGKPAQNCNSAGVQNAPQPVLESSICGTKIPMESSTCAIPIATDYLVVPYGFHPAVTPISLRPNFVQPVDRQTCSMRFLGPVNVPYGTYGCTPTPGAKPLAPCVYQVSECSLVSCAPCGAPMV